MSATRVCEEQVKLLGRLDKHRQNLEDSMASKSHLDETEALQGHGGFHMDLLDGYFSASQLNRALQGFPSSLRDPCLDNDLSLAD